jgi:ParB family chromosome partitioning protein
MSNSKDVIMTSDSDQKKPKTKNGNKKAPKKKASGLGRGLNALLGEVRTERPVSQQSDIASGARAIPLSNNGAEGGDTISMNVAADNGRDNLVEMLSIARITPHPDQPRRFFNDSALDELAASISQRGVIQPVIVRPAPGKAGHYQLVAGERRWRAAQRARLHEIPALVRELDERDTLTLALIENIQREDLTPIEEARAYRNLMEQDNLSHNELAQMVDKSRSHVANMIRLLNLPDSVLAMVDAGQLSMGHARALINAEDAREIAQKAVNDNLSVRQVEKLVRKKTDAGSHKTDERPAAKADDSDIAAVERHLSDLLGMNVTISPGKNPSTGDLTVRYSSLDQLDLLCQRLSGEPL